MTTLITSMTACGPEGTSPATPLEPQALGKTKVSCVNGDLGQRSRTYNESTFDSAHKAFDEHFKVWANAAERPIKGTSIPLDLNKFVALRNSLQPKPVAIQVNYGLNGDAFFPVFEFLMLTSDGADVESMNTYYVVDGDSLRKAEDTAHDPKKLKEEYLKNIRVKRTDAHSTWDSLLTVNTEFPDPLAEWFTFDLELNKLIADNPSSGKRTLVLNAISEPVCYSGTHGFLKASDTEEYRHMIAWYIAVDGQRQLDGASLSTFRVNGDIYHKRAMDLGHLCPPRCKK